MSELPETTLRVLAWPAYKTRESNPYPWLLYAHVAANNVVVKEYTPWRALLGTYDLVHIHWPDYQVVSPSRLTTLLRVFYFKAVVSWCKWRGARLVWTVHNLSSHEAEHPRLEAMLWKTVTNRVDACICLTHSGQRAALMRFPALRVRPMWVIRHGHYRGAYPDVVSRDAARARLCIDPGAAVILFFGGVRPYKNVPSLLSCFTQLKQKDAVLVVAGNPHSNSSRDQVVAFASKDPRIVLALHHVPTEDVQYFLRAADLVVLPFSEILNSGSALLALSFDCPVLVPRKGAMEDLRDTVGPDWVMTYETELTTDILDDAMQRATKPGRPRAPNLDKYEWASIANQTRSAFRQICGRGAGSCAEQAPQLIDSAGPSAT